MAKIELAGVTKRFPDGTEAVRELDLEIDDGEFMVLVGPSGCGKTTALRMVAGLESISDGELRIGDRVVNDMPPKDRDIAMVFQNYALYPHLSVRDNMAFGLKLAKVDKGEIDRRVNDAAIILGLEDLLDRKPGALSGGQRQRVAMGRAIVRKPQAFLMDEPLSNLDAKLRVQMRTEIARIQSDLKVTTIYVTHDQVEAMTMGDRVAVMRKGEVQQVGPPTELFANPSNIFVAGFIGSPSMNFLVSRLERDGDAYTVELADQRLELSDQVLGARPALRQYAGRDVILGIRPQDLEDAAFDTSDAHTCTLRITPDLVERIGTETIVHFPVEGRVAVTEDMKELAEDAGAEHVERLEQTASRGRVDFVAQVDPKSRATQGEPLDLVIDAAQMHFFDPDTSLWIGDGHATT